jgi:hypothetical protein
MESLVRESGGKATTETAGTGEPSTEFSNRDVKGDDTTAIILEILVFFG